MIIESLSKCRVPSSRARIIATSGPVAFRPVLRAASQGKLTVKCSTPAQFSNRIVFPPPIEGGSDEDTRIGVSLRAGANRILAKVRNWQHAFSFSLRVASEDRRPPSEVASE